MKRILLCVALVLVVASISEAGFLRRGRRGGCSNGQCGTGNRAAALPAAPQAAAPVRLNGFSSLDAIRGTARQCDAQGGCDR